MSLQSSQATYYTSTDCRPSHHVPTAVLPWTSQSRRLFLLLGSLIAMWAMMLHMTWNRGNQYEFVLWAQKYVVGPSTAMPRLGGRARQLSPSRLRAEQRSQRGHGVSSPFLPTPIPLDRTASEPSNGQPSKLQRPARPVTKDDPESLGPFSHSVWPGDLSGWRVQVQKVIRDSFGVSRNGTRTRRHLKPETMLSTLDQLLDTASAAGAPLPLLVLEGLVQALGAGVFVPGLEHLYCPTEALSRPGGDRTDMPHNTTRLGLAQQKQKQLVDYFVDRLDACHTEDITKPKEKEAKALP
uniref:Uncharacterized protein n=1 Tax=Eutreptiella gymnastica TaxID=73025 RepID=A0A7S4CWV1_9EUGL